MNFLKWIINIYRKCYSNIDFSGKMSRKDYWSFFFINVVIGFGLDFISNSIYLVFLGASILPGFSAGWRRANDAGYPGWMILIPFWGLVILLKPRREEVYISVKLYTNNFPEFPWSGKASAKQVVKFLLSDCGCAFTNKGEGTLIHGDKRIWYIGLVEKFGVLRYKDYLWKWNFGEASFSIVEEFIKTMYDDKFINSKQYNKLQDEIREGKKIPNYTDIGDYLLIQTNLN